MHSRFALPLCLALATTVASAQPVTNHLALPMLDLAKPAAGSSIQDPVFGTTICRLTDAAAAGQPGLCPLYAKRQAWNADESLLLITSGDGSIALHDGTTYQFKRALDGVGGDDVFWHPTATNLVLYNPQNCLYAHDVFTDQETLVCALTNFYFADTAGEGNLSRDGRYYAAYGRDYDETNGTVTPRAVVVMDLTAPREIGRLLLPTNLTDFDWVSISPLGNYVVIDYSTELTGPFEGVEVYDRWLTNRLWQKPLGSGHSDLGVDANGDEMLVMGLYDDQSNTTLLKKFRLRDGQETLLLSGMDWSFYNHISCRNEERSEWCFVSTYDGEGRLTDDPASWLPFEDEIFAVKLDGSQQVERLAHHRSRRFSPATPDSDTSVYWAEPHATVSRRGDRILFGSNWRQGVDNVTNVDAYICDFRQVLAPRLNARLSGRQLLLSWPNADPGWRLAFTTNLVSVATNLWMLIPPPYATNGANLQFTEPAPLGNKFYRLHKP
jgi:hypothetical protein